MADETMTDEQILKDVEHKSFAATSDRTAPRCPRAVSPPRMSPAPPRRPPTTRRARTFRCST
ncbi:MAG: hypothetical protein ACLU37_10550 [Collinsella sp.]